MAIHRSLESRVPPERRTGREEWSIAECMRILRRRKTTLLWITCLGVLVTALVSSGQPHIYQSRALLEIQAFNEDFLNLREIYPTSTLSSGAGLYLKTYGFQSISSDVPSMINSGRVVVITANSP